MVTTSTKKNRIIEIDTRIAAAYITAKQDAAAKLLRAFVLADDIVGAQIILSDPNINIERINNASSSAHSIVRVAVHHGNLSILRLLDEKGIKPRSNEDLVQVAISRTDAKKYDPVLAFVLEKGYYTQPHLDKAAEAVVRHSRPTRTHALDMVLEKGGNPEQTYPAHIFGYSRHDTCQFVSLLTHALIKRNYAAYKILIKHNADPFKIDGFELSPFHYSLRTGLEKRNQETPQASLEMAAIAIQNAKKPEDFELAEKTLADKQDLITNWLKSNREVKADTRVIKRFLAEVTEMQKTLRALKKLSAIVTAKRPTFENAADEAQTLEYA